MANKKMEGYNLGVRKGAWTKDEDDVLRQCIENHGGEGKWYQVPYKAGINVNIAQREIYDIDGSYNKASLPIKL
ncbi:hypothetical protein ACE6H2_011209 [Prunus campanulata]